jgi:hypothetical protein
VLIEDRWRSREVKLGQQDELDVRDGGLDCADLLLEKLERCIGATLNRGGLQRGDREGTQLDQPLTTALNALVTSRPCSPSSTGSKVQFFVYDAVGKISLLLASFGSRLARICLTPSTGVT